MTTTPQKTAEVKYIRFQNMFGRMIATGQLHTPEGKVLLDGSLAQMLTVCEAEGIVLSNAQYVLNHLVRTGGFGA